MGGASLGGTMYRDSTATGGLGPLETLRLAWFSVMLKYSNSKPAGIG